MAFFKKRANIDGEKKHNLLVKSLSTLFRGITSNHVGDFYCLNCCHSYRTKEKLIKHEKVWDDHDYCYVEIPNEDNKIFNIQPCKKVIKIFIYNLRWLRVFAWKNTLMSK